MTFRTEIAPTQPHVTLPLRRHFCFFCLTTKRGHPFIKMGANPNRVNKIESSLKNITILLISNKISCFPFSTSWKWRQNTAFFLINGSLLRWVLFLFPYKYKGNGKWNVVNRLFQYLCEKKKFNDASIFSHTWRILKRSNVKRAAEVNDFSSFNGKFRRGKKLGKIRKHTFEKGD